MLQLQCWLVADGVVLLVLLQAGQMLYLPAGWFHEVTSFGGGGEWRCVTCISRAPGILGFHKSVMAARLQQSGSPAQPRFHVCCRQECIAA
jgi:hypothetical protein